MQLCDKDIFDWLSDETWYCHNGFRLVDQDGSDVDMAQKGETMGETKQFSKRIQDILDGLELRTGKKKVQTKEDLKKCFKKICLNAYSAEENGQPRLYRRNDLTQWAAETFCQWRTMVLCGASKRKRTVWKITADRAEICICVQQTTDRRRIRSSVWWLWIRVQDR